MTGGWHYYAKRGTIRMPPWPEKVPFTKGDERTTIDVALYLALIASLVVALALPGVQAHGINRHVAHSQGLVPPVAFIPAIVLSRPSCCSGSSGCVTRRSPSRPRSSSTCRR
jgi:hypothetical protein